MISYFKLQGSTPLVCISFLACLLSFQVILDMMDSRFSLFDNVGSKYHFLSRLNPIERCMASSSIKSLKWCQFQTLLVAIIVRELSPGQILVPTSLMFQNTCSQYIFKDLVDSLSLAIRPWVISRTVDQVSPEGRVQLLPKVSDKLQTSVRAYQLQNSM
jgi:hypothetical protein